MWGSGKCRLTAGFWLLAFGASLQTPQALAQQTPDFTEAEAMLHFLQSCAAGKASPQELDRLIALPGTELVVEQQSISRRVTMEQYRRCSASALRSKDRRCEADRGGNPRGKGSRGAYAGRCAVAAMGAGQLATARVAARGAAPQSIDRRCASARPQISSGADSARGEILCGAGRTRGGCRHRASPF